MKEIRGVIDQCGTRAAFVSEASRFTFLPVDDESESCNIWSVPESLDRGVLKSENNFLHGRTYDGRNVLIHSVDTIHLMPTAMLDTQLYIVSKGNDPLETYDAIEFIGGSVNSTFEQSSLNLEIAESGGYKAEFIDDTVVLSINENGVQEITIGSGNRVKWSINEGNAIENTGAKLRLIFNEEKHIGKTVTRYYSDIEVLISFLAFRKNVRFDRVRLLKWEHDCGEVPFLTETAECFVRYEFREESPRDCFRCLTFNKVGAVPAEKLYKLVAKRNSKKCCLSADFIPSSNKNVWQVTSQKIKDICTAIELEASLRQLSPTCSVNFEMVVHQMKDVVNANVDRLTKRELDYLNGSLRHMRGPAVELAEALFDSQRDTVEPIIRLFGTSDFSSEHIHRLISARNSLTHAGGGVSVDDALVVTTYVFMAVVYSSILDRCGVSHAVIREAFESGLLTD